MADLNPNIILGIKPVDLPNPLDSATKALTMSNLMQEHQSNTIKLNEQQRQASDTQTLRDAFKNNTQSDPDGNPVMNRQGIMQDLMKANPMLAQKQALDFKQMDLDNMTRQHAIAKSILFDITPGDQASLERANAAAQKNGLPPLTNVLPQDVNDPNFGTALRNAQMKSLTAEEQIAQMNKQQEMAMTQQKNNIDLAREQREANQFGYTKRFEANQQVEQAINGSRQADDMKQALRDVQAADKVNGLLAQAKNPKTGQTDYNQLDNQQIRLLYGEVGKIAQGGAPTEGGLHDMTPETAKAIMADYKSIATNKPVPAEMGAFVNKIKAYTDELGSQGRKRLADNDNAIVDQRRNDLGPENYQNYKSGIQKRYGGDGAGQMATAAPKGSGAAGPKTGIMDFNQWKAQQASGNSKNSTGG